MKVRHSYHTNPALTLRLPD